MNFRFGEYVGLFCVEIIDGNVFKGIYFTREIGDDVFYIIIKMEFIIFVKEYFYKRFFNFQEDLVFCGVVDLSNFQLQLRER